MQELLDRYASLIVEVGANVQENQIVLLLAEAYHRELAFLIARKAYERGAKLVQVELTDPRLLRERILNSSDENLSFIPAALEPKYRELVDTHGAAISLVGPEFPTILADLDPVKINQTRKCSRQAIRYFYEEGIGHSKSQWTIAAVATPEWAQRLFPTLTPRNAETRLWEEIFKICRVDTPDYVSTWTKLKTNLARRALRLDELNIKTLHFTGPETDLYVGLSEKAIFKSVAEDSAQGISFQANIPSEEVFTAPDWRTVEGRAKATRPFLVNGKLIKGLRLEFFGGEISSFTADEGEETFRAYINSDEGARRLGEVALVGVDSPIFQSGIVFEEILLDENAACHIAIGSAYHFCVRGSSKLSKDELQSIGFNESCVHTDMMISDQTVNVDAKLRSGSTIRLISNGEWQQF